MPGGYRWYRQGTTLQYNADNTGGADAGIGTGNRRTGLYTGTAGHSGKGQSPERQKTRCSTCGGYAATGLCSQPYSKGAGSRRPNGRCHRWYTGSRVLYLNDGDSVGNTGDCDAIGLHQPVAEGAARQARTGG